MTGSTIERLAKVDEPEWRHVFRRRRLLHRLVAGVLAAIMLLAVLDGIDVLDSMGPDERRVTAAGGGFDLHVEYPSVARPALASVFRITVSHIDGFDEPLQIAVSRRYLEGWDLNGILPSPSAETAVGRWIIWEFDPPPGERFTVTYESRIEPGQQTSLPGEVAVLVEEEPVAQVAFTTRIRS